MEFKDVLNRYMERTGCSARDLAERSGLSTATISRYRSGDRVPEADSRQLENLAKGIAAIAAEKKIREMEEEAVRQALSEQAQGPGIEIEKLRLNFDTLLKTLSVSVSDLARFLSYDPSYLSRIRKGQRKLSDPQKFTADAFLKLDAKTEGTRWSILSSLPLYTADDELVFQVLRDNRVSEKNQIRIMEHIAFQRELTEEILSHDSIFEAYPNFSKDEFAQYPMTLSLAGAFYEEDIVYTYEQYREHLEMMKRFSQMHKNYHIEENKSPAFRHIQILIHEGSWAIVSKEKTPAIHFVIRHPKMREAMENITMPIVEGEEYISWIQVRNAWFCDVPFLLHRFPVLWICFLDFPRQIPNLLVAGKHIGCSAGAMEPVFIKPEEAGIPIRCLKLQDPAVCRAAESFGYNGRFP